MDVTRKDATITNTDEEFPGSFEVVLSTAAKDRDGDELAADDWKQPLPDHITFDQDHLMSVAGTVGSGVPTLEDGRLIVRGTYSSLPRAQEVRTLVKEGHIRTTSVAFMSEKSTKDGKTRVTRELLNGAFVAIPANREAVVLAAKSYVAQEIKAGARNSAADAARIQAIHDHAVALGAGPSDDTGAAEDATGGKAARRVIAKAVSGSYEQRAQAIQDALDSDRLADGIEDGLEAGERDGWAYTVATFDDRVVFHISGSLDDDGDWQATYTVGADGTVTLGEPQRVNVTEQITPIPGATEDGGDDPAPAAPAKAAPAAETDTDDLDLQCKALTTLVAAYAAD